LAPEAAGRIIRCNDTKTGSDGGVMINGIDDAIILVARLFLAALFLIFGWRKLRDISGTVRQMVGDGVPTPGLATAIAIFMELPVSLAIAVGAFARPFAVLMALYTLGTSLVEHRYWTISGADYVDKMEAFYKNLSIIGGFLLLYITGAGKYSLDAWVGRRRAVTLLLLGCDRATRRVCLMPDL
jgi:putative oxidoreductase